jgi:hypothetical protein
MDVHRRNGSRLGHMTSKAAYGLAGLLLLAGASGLAPSPALAQPTSLQDVPLPTAPKISPWPDADDQQPQEAADPAAAETPTTAATEDTDIANLDIDWSLLDIDASTLMTTNPVRLHGGPPAAPPPSSDMAWSSQPTPYGSAVSVKQPVSPFLDARIGADMTVVRQPSTLAELLAEKASNGGNDPQSSGTAWATVSAPGVGSIWDKTAVEARVDPAQDQGKLGASLSKSLAFGDQYSLTLQNGYNVTQGFAPMPGATGHAIYGTEQSARLGITDTGTSFSAGQTMSTVDDKWLRKIGAEQKIVGGFNISGSIAETPLGIANKSISAGFKQSW